jgi:GNAT superfamily N-acetyltransferase
MSPDLRISEIRDKHVIEQFLREDPFMHLYGIGDLDDFFWPDTKWMAFTIAGRIRSIVLLYNDVKSPVLLALNHRKSFPVEMQRSKLGPFLPQNLNAHLTPDYRKLLESEFNIKSTGIHYKMGLTDTPKSLGHQVRGIHRLGINNRNELNELYRQSYPGNWFNEKMLQTGWYYGLRYEERLVSVAGVHVFSEKFRIAALGNITTHPAYRNRGFAGRVTACLCRDLSDYADHIGLNVHGDNVSAIRCYQQLGFRITGRYEECQLIRR